MPGDIEPTLGKIPLRRVMSGEPIETSKLFWVRATLVSVSVWPIAACYEGLPLDAHPVPLLSRLRENFSRVEDFPPADAVHLNTGAVSTHLPCVDKRHVVVAGCSIELAWRFAP